jgi:predicted CXXCH cytochrome family protein
MYNKYLISVLIMALCSILFLGITSCSKETKYNTLTVFFDGVPKPDDDQLQKVDSTNNSANMNLQKMAPLDLTTYHPPYADNNCASCHDQEKGSKLLQPQPELCNNCHESFATKYKVLHGPVESGYCTECHSPHSSEFKKLLVKDKQKLCYKCHNKADVMKNDVHSSIDETVCWDCHNPHGGSDRTFMR